MNNSCTPFVRLISARIDNALEGAHAGQLEEHLAACSRCRARELSLLAQGEALRMGAARRLDALEECGRIDLTNFADRVLLAARAEERRPMRWARFKLALRERWEHQRLALSASLGVAAAGCAALAMLFAIPHPQRLIERTLLASQDQASQASQASIDDLELMTGTTGAVFEVPGQTTVIWVSDEVAE